ncbi:hypothetical protein NEOLEDRAFT_652230 [Neolentinus lepideus HHB14362 ss-1]|uniref:Uncharacterized protein n=1 Tax=Neolentinus lepideus HHB14362 ss-1 TaxID=1314782 RepID=A0A165QJL1_9AGAM|nr:hypothetical protein NEOLEDRAFT_652230 [Neolentinus lepideus HHB14362 ss-1]
MWLYISCSLTANSVTRTHNHPHTLETCAASHISCFDQMIWYSTFLFKYSQNVISALVQDDENQFERISRAIWM